ncbi:MAG: hypothetical protein OTI36_20610 [Beijerinckiaceae bacterium]|nr:hypothetical protein [Beijerinckiaceae bacterium]
MALNLESLSRDVSEDFGGLAEGARPRSRTPTERNTLTERQPDTRDSTFLLKAGQ